MYFDGTWSGVAPRTGVRKTRVSEKIELCAHIMITILDSLLNIFVKGGGESM